LSFKMIHRHSSCYLFYYSTLFDSRFKTLQQNPRGLEILVKELNANNNKNNENVEIDDLF
ncbi:MAG: hypothetical protein E6169_13845, partial [Enterococcus faecalis]|uniref:hypothetical protein n=1 Tax=Peptostreptococcus sp. TaxID=1262 RepID=UPI0003D678B4